MKFTANIGHCSECRLPMLIIDGVPEVPDWEPDAVLYFDTDPVHNIHRATWHKPDCVNLCTSDMT